MRSGPACEAPRRCIDGRDAQARTLPSSLKCRDCVGRLPAEGVNIRVDSQYVLLAMLVFPRIAEQKGRRAHLTIVGGDWKHSALGESQGQL